MNRIDADLSQRIEQALGRTPTSAKPLPGGCIGEVVMLAFDNSDITREGVRMLADSPLFRGLTCHLVQVSRGATPLTNDLEKAKTLLEESGHSVETVILQGDIEPALHQYRRDHDVDMVIMGAYGDSRLRDFLLGSTTNDMIRHATVPHLLLR